MVNSSNGTHDENGNPRRFVLPGPPGMMRTGTTAAEDATPRVEGMEVVRRMLCADGGGGGEEFSSSLQDDDDDDDDDDNEVSERASDCSHCMCFRLLLLSLVWRRVSGADGVFLRESLLVG